MLKSTEQDIWQEKSLFHSILGFMSSWNFIHIWDEHEKKVLQPKQMQMPDLSELKNEIY